MKNLLQQYFQKNQESLFNHTLFFQTLSEVDDPSRDLQEKYRHKEKAIVGYFYNQKRFAFSSEKTSIVAFYLLMKGILSIRINKEKGSDRSSVKIKIGFHRHSR